MTSMVERVAKELAKCRWEQLGIAECDRPEWAKQARGFDMKQARAAIEAMRDLTKPMMFYGMDAMLRDDLEPTEAEFTRGYQAAIDAALNEEGQG